MKYSTFCESLLYIKMAKLVLSESLNSLQVNVKALNILLKGKKFFYRASLSLDLGRRVRCQLWCVLQQDIIAYRLCNPFIVEFLYFFSHMDGGLNTNVIMLTEAEKLPVSLKLLWLQLTTVVKLREIFLCVDHLWGISFFGLFVFSSCVA